MTNNLKPGDLMIGNYLQDKHGRLCKVEGIKTDSFYVSPIEGTISTLPYEPIPLTPEILERCGFVKRFIVDGLIKYELGTLILFSDTEGFIFVHSHNNGRVILTHLHQLQNLATALGVKFDVK